MSKTRRVLVSTTTAGGAGESVEYTNITGCTVPYGVLCVEFEDSEGQGLLDLYAPGFWSKVEDLGPSEE